MKPAFVKCPKCGLFVTPALIRPGQFGSRPVFHFAEPTRKGLDRAREADAPCGDVDRHGNLIPICEGS